MPAGLSMNWGRRVKPLTSRGKGRNYPSTGDVWPLSHARANLSELADQARAGREKIITKNGESCVALIDAARLDYDHQLERARIHLLVLQGAEQGLADVAAGRVVTARVALAERKARRGAKGA